MADKRCVGSILIPLQSSLMPSEKIGADLIGSQPGPWVGHRYVVLAPRPCNGFCGWGVAFEIIPQRLPDEGANLIGIGFSDFRLCAHTVHPTTISFCSRR